MELTVISPDTQLPCDRGHCITMVIKSFKGRRNVEVQLFRPSWDQAEETEYEWDTLLDNSAHTSAKETISSVHVIMESFTTDERDRIIEYLKGQYSTRLQAIRSRPLNFPVPSGLLGLSDMREGKNVGLIRFEKIPSYSLGLPLRGFYDLSQHRPIVGS